MAISQCQRLPFMHHMGIVALVIYLNSFVEAAALLENAGDPIGSVIQKKGPKYYANNITLGYGCQSAAITLSEKVDLD